MKAAFDDIASHYDDEFTYSDVGALQREKVWDYLNKALPTGCLSILELNCGTGEDALHFARQGHKVVATDLSSEMVAVAMAKATKNGLENQISFSKYDINKIEDIDFNRKFDVIFSNFGGLNCVDAMALKKLSKVASRLLNPHGRLIGVIMPKFCFWESLYFLGKISFRKAFRRAKEGPLKVQINKETVETWYYSPARMTNIFKDEFQLKRMKPIGIFLPPSYLQTYFGSRKNFLSRLDKFEHQANRFPILSYCSDHFLIDFELINAKS